MHWGLLLSPLLLLALEHRGALGKSCPQYSWLGPDSKRQFGETELKSNPINSLKLSNRTCKDFPKPKPIPCVTPFLVTEQADGAPNYEDIYNGFQRQTMCDPGEGRVCALVAFFFSGKIVNLTAYCTLVYDDDDKSLKSGCITARKGAFTNTVCVCDPSSNPTCDDMRITNSAPSTMLKRNAYSSILLVCLTLIQVSIV